MNFTFISINIPPSPSPKRFEVDLHDRELFIFFPGDSNSASFVLSTLKMLFDSQNTCDIKRCNTVCLQSLISIITILVTVGQHSLWDRASSAPVCTTCSCHDLGLTTWEFCHWQPWFTRTVLFLSHCFEWKASSFHSSFKRRAQRALWN